MDFRENRLVFQETTEGPPAVGGGGGSLTGDAAPEGAPSVESPKNHYDTATNTYYDEHGNPSSMDPSTAAGFGYLSSEPYVTEAPAVAASTAEQRAEVADETQAKLLGLDKIISLSALKEAMKGDFQAVVEVLKDKKMSGDIKFGQLTPKFLPIGGEDAFKEAVRTQLTDADIETLKSAFGTVYNLKDVDFREFLPKIAAVATLGVFQSTIHAKYPHILTFDKFKDGIVKINYDLNFDPESPALNLSLSSGAQDSYDQHAAAEQKKVEEAAKGKEEADTKQAEDQRLATDKEAFKDQLRKHPIGAFLVDFFDGPGPDGKPGMIDKLFDGKSPILAFLLGALGVGKFKDSYDNVRRMADKNPKLKGLLDQVDEKVKPYRVDTPEAAIAATAAAAEAPKFPQADKKIFAKVIGGEVPEGGVQLSEQYPITGKILKVNLHGSSLILPKGTSLNIKDKSSESAIDADRPFRDQELLLVGAIPKGTIFHKGVKLELVSV